MFAQPDDNHRQQTCSYAHYPIGWRHRCDGKRRPYGYNLIQPYDNAYTSSNGIPNVLIADNLGAPKRNGNRTHIENMEQLTENQCKKQNVVTALHQPIITIMDKKVTEIYGSDSAC